MKKIKFVLICLFSILFISESKGQARSSKINELWIKYESYELERNTISETSKKSFMVSRCAAIMNEADQIINSVDSKEQDISDAHLIRIWASGDWIEGKIESSDLVSELQLYLEFLDDYSHILQQAKFPIYAYSKEEGLFPMSKNVFFLFLSDKYYLNLAQISYDLAEFQFATNYAKKISVLDTSIWCLSNIIIIESANKLGRMGELSNEDFIRIYSILTTIDHDDIVNYEEWFKIENLFKTYCNLFLKYYRNEFNASDYQKMCFELAELYIKEPKYDLSTAWGLYSKLYFTFGSKPIIYGETWNYYYKILEFCVSNAYRLNINERDDEDLVKVKDEIRAAGLDVIKKIGDTPHCPTLLECSKNAKLLGDAELSEKFHQLYITCLEVEAEKERAALKRKKKQERPQRLYLGFYPVPLFNQNKEFQLDIRGPKYFISMGFGDLTKKKDWTADIFSHGVATWSGYRANLALKFPGNKTPNTYTGFMLGFSQKKYNSMTVTAEQNAIKSEYVFNPTELQYELYYIAGLQGLTRFIGTDVTMGIGVTYNTFNGGNAIWQNTNYKIFDRFLTTRKSHAIYPQVKLIWSLGLHIHRPWDFGEAAEYNKDE